MAESVGRKLQQARLARKLGIEDVAEQTKIRPDRIIDLEADEYSHFPNLTYAKSFLAKYASFLGRDIQEELDKFQISPMISMGDYQYLSSITAHNQGQQPRWTQRIQPKGFRVPPAVVVVLVLIMLVGVPVFSYVAINIRRVAGTNFADTIDKTVGTASDSDSVKSLAAQSPSEERTAVASPSASQQQAVKADASAVRIEDGIEVRRALPVGASQSATPIKHPLKSF